MNFFKKIAITAFAVSTFSLVHAVEKFPSKPITIVVPYPAGGSVDLLIRKLGIKISDISKQPVIVENKPGASTSIAAAYVAKSRPDGHTWLVGDNTTYANNKFLLKNIQYNIDTDLQPVTTLSQGSLVLIVKNDGKINNLNDIINNKEKMFHFATPGNGTPHHIFTESLIQKTNIKAQHVPYRGEMPGFNDLVGGQIDFMFMGARGAKELSTGGKIKIIGWAGSAINESFPEIELIRKYVPGFAEELTQGIFVQKATDKSKVDAIAGYFKQALEDKEMRDWLNSYSMGVTYTASSPEEFEEIVKKESQKSEALIKNSGIKVD